MGRKGDVTRIEATVDCRKTSVGPTTEVSRR